MPVSEKDLHRHLSIARGAHRRLLAGLGRLLDDEADEGRLDGDRPTLLAGWSRSMVITHLARNAESQTRMIVGAGRGEELDQYPGGIGERNAGVEEGRGRPLAEAVADLAAATRLLEESWAETDWLGFGRRGRSQRTPISELPFLRTREVELHHVDLDIGTTFDDLDPTYIRLDVARLTMLWTARQPMGMTSLPPAVLALSPGQRLAWLSGRRDLDGVTVPQLI